LFNLPQFILTREQFCASLLRKNLERKEKRDARVLYEMPLQERNEKRHRHQNEERQAGYEGRLPGVRHEDVQNRERLKQEFWASK
jgi:hypothetical protein